MSVPDSARQLDGSPVDVPAPALERVRRLVIEQPLIMLGVILVLLVIACVIAESSYLSTGQLGAILRYAAPLAIMAGGQTLAMLTRGIDLSMSATATASAYVMASNTSHGALYAIALGLCVGLAVGLVNGIGIGIFRVQPLIMTLGMAGIVTGILTAKTATGGGGTSIPSIVNTIGAGSLFGKGALDFIPTSLILWIVVSVVLILLLSRTGFGRMLYAYGNNPQAMRLAGMRAWQLLTGTYVIIGLLSAVAGMTLAGLINSAELGLADSYLLPSIAAAVIGGTSIFGGIGTYGGTIMGAVILTVLDSFLTLLNVSQALQQIVYGLVILVLVTVYAQVQRRT